MDIAAMSMGMKQSDLMVKVSMSMTKKTMDLASQQMQGMVDMMKTAGASFGHSLDIRV